MQTSSTIALITGGGRGLGKNAALQLAEQGHDVILTWHSRPEAAEAVRQQIQVMGRQAAVLRLDTSDVPDFGRFAAQLSSLLEAHWGRSTFDFLVNNAGIDSHSMIGQTSEAQFDALMQVHFKGVYFLTQTLLPMIADGGRIINVSTGLARFTIPGYGAYAAMKSAVETFTRYLAKEVGSRGITANVIAPGAVETDFTAPAFTHHPEIKTYIASQTALGRVGQPEDIGGIVAFLCSPAARWINAQRIEASGGMML